MSFLVLKVLAFISSETVFEKSENQATLWIKHVNQKYNWGGLLQGYQTAH